MPNSSVKRLNNVSLEMKNRLIKSCIWSVPCINQMYTFFKKKTNKWTWMHECNFMHNNHRNVSITHVAIHKMARKRGQVQIIHFLNVEWFWHIPHFLAYKTLFFSPEKCGLHSTCILCAEGKYYFQTYNTCTSIIQHFYCGMILVAVTMIFWVCVMNKYIMVDNFGM
jgi:hypothetical protein